MRTVKRSKLFLGFVICLFFAYFTTQAPVASSAGVEYPTKQIKLIIPFAAGSTLDVLCRKLIDLVKTDIGQEIVVEYKVGAGGMVGIRYLSKSKPDGYTIGVITPTALLVTPFFQDVDFTYKDFSLISQFSVADHPLSVRADSAIKTFKDFVEEARKREVTIAGTGMTSADFAMMRLASTEKLNLKIVAYGGAPPSIAAVLGGHTDAVITSGYYQYVRDGKLRPLCQTTGARNVEFPEVPTLKELGYNIEISVFFGLAGPKGLPEPIREKLEKVFSKGIHDPSFAPNLKNFGHTFVYKGSKEWGKFLEEAYVNSEKEFKELGLGKFSKEKK
jgi:tripartite-type tricarboxylate transporter receptor subunit TctC